MAAVVTFNPLALRRSVMLGQQTGGGGGLPAGYTQLKYIETNGPQLIITDARITDYTDIVRATGAFTAGVQQSDYFIHGGVAGRWVNFVGSNSRQSPYTQKPVVVQYSARLNYANPFIDVGTFVTAEGNPNNNTVTIDGVVYNPSDRWDRYEVTPGYYRLFGSSDSAGTSYVKLQSAEVAGKGLFIPCMRDADGTVGVCNTITGNFLTNTGTGTLGYETMDGVYVAPTN